MERSRTDALLEFAALASELGFESSTPDVEELPFEWVLTSGSELGALTVVVPKHSGTAFRVPSYETIGEYGVSGEYLVRVGAPPAEVGAVARAVASSIGVRAAEVLSSLRSAQPLGPVRLDAPLRLLQTVRSLGGTIVLERSGGRGGYALPQDP